MGTSKTNAVNIFCGMTLDEPLPIEYFKLARKIKCLPLLEPKLLDDNLKRLKHKRRDIKRAVRRIVLKKN